MYSKTWRVCLGLGPINPWIRLLILVNPERLGDRKIPHGVGGENPVVSILIFFPSYRVEVVVKPVMTFLLCWPTNLGWITIKPRLC